MELVADDDLVDVGDPESFLGSTYLDPINAHLGSTYSNPINPHEEVLELSREIVRERRLMRSGDAVSEDGFCIGGIKICYEEQSAGESVSARVRRGSGGAGV